TRASAGGRLERILQADAGAPLRYGDTEDRGEMSMVEDSAVANKTPEGQETVEGAVDIKETFVSPSLRDEHVEESLQQLREEVRRERRLLACERELDGALRACALPAPVRERVERRFRGRLFESGDLDAAIADERDMLAALTDAGLVRGMGFEKSIRVGMNEAEKLQKAFDQLFDIHEGERVPTLGGIREAYVVATGDAAISGVTAPERLREADVTTATFSYLLGTSMNKRLLHDYQAWPSEWQKFCTVTPIRDFKQQDRIRLGAFGSLSTVPEDTAYTTLTLADTRAIYTPQKRGNLVAVTRETVVNDDLHAIRQIPGKLAVAAAFTLAEFVYSFLTATSNIYDGSPLFTKGGAHNNSAVTTPGTANSGAALASAAMQSGVTAMRRQTNLAGKPIGLKPRYLVVSPELEWQSMVITKSAGAPGVNYNDINPMLGYAEVIVAPQLTSATGWYLACDPRVVDTVEIGFVGGQLNPVLFVQDQPLYGANFTNDVLTYKVRHEYGGAVVDYRGLYQGNN
ncbi:MAG: Mu-like prophage major head subunit gpT family protein, partial [Chloroflexota bacterium]|nr:Mu-like prophage major head subunit gpT family protein [Chloroflexota bacterium]